MAEVLSKIPILLFSLAIWFVINTLVESPFTSLNAVHPALPYVPIVGIFGLAILIWKYSSQQELKNKKHSTDLARAFAIMSKGEFEKKGKDYQFCIPYPYEEYLKYEQIMRYPTLKDGLVSLDEINMGIEMKGETFDFVTFEHSNDAPFSRANKHLESYKDIVVLHNKAKEACIIAMEYWQTNNVAAEYNKARAEGKPNDVPNPEFDRLSKLAANALLELQKSLDRLSQRLEDGAVVKGECELGY